jgi:predicted nuclease of predicted toxin-antitoxin system
VRFLIDECVHTSLIELAHRHGNLADHVNYLGLGGSGDDELMAIVIERDYTFVTNNRSDFLKLFGKESIHAGLVVIVPNVSPTIQRELFDAVLEHVGSRQLINSVIEVNFGDERIECAEYTLFKEK